MPLYNDNYSSEKFAEMFKGKLMFCKPLGGWFSYDGRKWVLEPNIKKYAVDVYKSLISELADYEYDAHNPLEKLQYEKFAKYVHNSGNDPKLNAMVNCAHAYMSFKSDKFDANPDIFNCNNKTIDLKLFKARNFDPLDLLTKSTPIDHIPGSSCLTWIKFVNDIFLGREEIIDFIQRYLGYSLTTSTKEQCMCIFNGDGRNGKSTFIEIIRKIFGDYAAVCPTSTLIAKQHDTSIPNDIAGLKGSRLITMIETNPNVTLDEACIKKLTGSDMIKVRFLHKEWFEYMPTFKIIFSSNHRPNIRGTDSGIWRRIRMIPFDFKVEDNNDDRDLPDKLTAELPGIFLWIIEGYKKWKESGLTTPASIMETTDEYKYEEDQIGQFIEDECDIDAENYIRAEEFKERIRTYNKYITPKSINEYMRKKGWKPKEDRLIIDGDRVRCFIGIGFKRNHKKQQDYSTSNWRD